MIPASALSLPDISAIVAIGGVLFYCAILSHWIREDWKDPPPPRD